MAVDTPAQTPLMKLTGERPIIGKTPPSLLALHTAGYREVAARLGHGRVLDLGCGLGDETVALAGSDRTVIGLDYDAPTALAACRRNGLLTVAAEGTQIPFRNGALDWVCSSHLIEHFVEPAAHVAEVARTVALSGSAFFITPNAPADFENPYHVSLFEPRQLAELLGRYFDDVEVLGLDGDPVVKADFEQRRRLARRMLAIDVFGLRHRLPRSAYVRLHAVARRVAYPSLAVAKRLRRATPAEPITAARFELAERIDPSTLVLFAIARRPRRRLRPT